MEVLIEQKLVKVHLTCDDHPAVEMTRIEAIRAKRSLPMFIFQCPICGVEKSTYQNYPYFKYEDITPEETKTGSQRLALNFIQNKNS